MGWLGNFLVILGTWQVGNKRRWGFLALLASCFCWGAVGYQKGMLDLVFIEAVLGIVSVRNYLRWKKK